MSLLRSQWQTRFNSASFIVIQLWIDITTTRTFFRTSLEIPHAKDERLFIFCTSRGIR